MKNITSAFLTVILFLTFSNINSNSQWQPDVRLTNASGSSFTSYNNAWSIAASGNVLHAIWRDNRDGNNEIYYKRSTDGGTIWAADIRLTNNTANSYAHGIAISGSLVHVVWIDTRDGNSQIYYKSSTDGGTNWGADTRLTNNTAGSYVPSVAVSGLVVYVVWQDERDGNTEIYYKHSTDNGTTWGADTRLTNNIASSDNPSIAVSGSQVNVVWFDYRDNNNEIYYKRSTDGGVSWGADTRLTNNAAKSESPSIAVYGLVVYVVWQDERDGNTEIYYKHSTDNGTTWGADTRLTNNTAGSYFPSVAVSGSQVHIVWREERDGNAEIYYKPSTDGGNTWGTDTRLTNNTAVSDYPSIAVSGTQVNVVWFDSRDGNNEIYYKRDPTGNVVGITNINSEIPADFSLSQNYPNPFNPTTNFEFRIAEFGFVNLTIYDVMGREVATLVNGNLKPGTYKADWDASNFVSGVYFYKLTSGDFSKTKRMVLIK